MQRIFILIIFLLTLSNAQAAESFPLTELKQKAGHIHGIAVKPDDPLQLYVATHHGLYTASMDGMVAAVSDAKHDFMSFAVHPTETKLLYGSGHPAGGGNLGFIGSTDSGKTWRQISPGVKGPVDFHAMTVSTAGPKVIYGIHGGLQVSRDGGLTWELVGPLPKKTIDLAASGTAVETLYTGTAEGLLVSRDGGKSWQSAYPSKNPAPLVEAEQNGVIYAFIVGVGLLKYQDNQWTRLSKRLRSRILFTSGS
ncbi:MAG: exo-alpha-sialidase [Candidatus Competibacteraceae bacterium]|nr:exo-alpha-sialidase [Candidatus Competibacteraceae bacterium]